MATMLREKTKFPGVTFVWGIGADGKPEKIFYIRYRRGGRQIEEKAGRQYQDDMTPARANALRTDRIQGREPSNEERRQEERQSQDRWTIERLWLEYKTQKSLKGIVTDENRFQKHLTPFVDKEPTELSPLDIDRLRVRMLKTHKPATVRNTLELLRRIVNFAAKKHLCPGVGFVIEMPRVNNIKTEDLTPKELERLLDAIEADENIQAANFMKMVLFTGMRRGELFKLRWRHIDFERGFIHITDPKGGPDQKIPLNSLARDLLDSHPRTNSEHVFPGRNGAQRVDINKQVQRIKRTAGLPSEFRALHGLRHVYATMLASSGKVDMYTLQKLMTHKSPQMTQRYAHLRDEALRKASDLAGTLLSGVLQNTDSETGLRLVR